MADHDGGYKLLFSHPQMVEELLRGFIHEPWVTDLDFSTLEEVPTNLVSDDFQQRHTDIAWRLRWRGSSQAWFYVYLLIEFQSTTDRFMALRLLGYIALLLGRLVRDGDETTGNPLHGRLPVVLPLVLYNGRKPWNAPLDLAELFGPVPPGTERYLPQLTYLLIDESRLTAEDLALPGNRVATLFRLETANPADLPQLTAELDARLPREQEPELRRAFAAWLLRLLRRFTPPGVTIPAEVTDLKEIAMLEETLQEWMNGARREGEEAGRRKGESTGRREGEATGRREGMRDSLLLVLEQRFGKLPAKVRRQVSSLSSAAEIAEIQRRALRAASLEELQLA